MDVRELINDIETTVREAIMGFLGDVMTIYPVIIKSFDPETCTCTAQVLLSFQVTQPLVDINGNQTSGEWKAAQPDPIIKCPVVFISGGGFTMIAPPQPGDEALGLFACKSIDQWWYYSGVQQRVDLRTHHLNDCFVLAGVRSLPNVLPNVKPNAFEIRSTDGLTKITLDATGVTITSSQPIKLEGDVNISGGLSVAGDVKGGQIDLLTHKHSGVATGGGTSGPPIP